MLGKTDNSNSECEIRNAESDENSECEENSEFGIRNSESGDGSSVPDGAKTKRKTKRGKLENIETMETNDVKQKNSDINSTANGSEENNSELDSNSELDDALAAEKDKYLRLAAEYDNFRKRSIKERETTYNDARADTITRLLPIYDNLERALKMECADEAFYKGIEMTMTGLTEILENMDIRRIQAVGEQFDPKRHNAVMTIEDPELGEKIVAEEFQKGFMLGDRVIRFSTVIVAN